MIYKGSVSSGTYVINLSFDVLYPQNALLKESVANIMLTNVAYGIAPFREKPTVMEATNKRMNVVVNFSIIGRPPYLEIERLKIKSTI